MKNRDRFMNGTHIRKLAPIHQSQTEINQDLACDEDIIIDESPLSIKLHGQTLAVMMRSAFSIEDDRDLVCGYLYQEGIIQSLADLEQCEPCVSRPQSQMNVFLAPGVYVDGPIQARFLNSSCGLCSVSHLNEVCQKLNKIQNPMHLTQAQIDQLLLSFKGLGSAFKLTGGCHVGALYDANFHLIGIKEDIGRHHVVDKLAGLQLRLAKEIQENRKILVISSRAGFEIVQKAVKMGVQAVVCLGAGSQMAIDLAIAMALPLYTFAKMGKSNRFIGKSNESHQASHN